MSKENHKPRHRFRTEELLIDPGPPRWFAPAGVKTYVATLGTSTPSPNPFRFGAAGAVIVNETPYLIDAGEGILRAIAKTDCFERAHVTVGARNALSEYRFVPSG